MKTVRTPCSAAAAIVASGSRHAVPSQTSIQVARPPYGERSALRPAVAPASAAAHAARIITRRADPIHGNGTGRRLPGCGFLLVTPSRGHGDRSQAEQGPEGRVL